MNHARIFGFLFLALWGINCASVPLTGRRQLNFVPQSELLSMSTQNYQEVLRTSKLSSNKTQTSMVKRVGQKIQKAVETYMAQNKMSDKLRGYKWEFNLIDDPTVNAWCMPGGKVVVYTGILPITKDESGLAVVLGHEIAHAVANHGGERMSQELLVQKGEQVLSQVISVRNPENQAIFMKAIGTGAALGILLPYSRRHESEADHLGLIFMAMAGYDPHLAVDFWKRMATMSQGQSAPKILSTHPPDSQRIRDIEKELPAAMKYYHK
jgi:predicted Zn-dependent protease